MRDGLKKIVDERDEGAFRSLFLTFGPKVRAMLMRQGADCETADDIVQDTMLAVWSKSRQYTQQKAALSTWIYAIARNLRIDRLRRQVVWDNCRGELEHLQDLKEQTENAQNHDDDRLEVEKALTGLPAEQLEVIRLSFIDGFSQVEIAEKLGIPLGTVKSRMRLAFAKLRCSNEGGS